MGNMAISMDYPKRECNTLQLLCQVAIVKILHQKAIQIDSNYKKWSEKTLAVGLRETESKTDVRFIDTAQVLRDLQLASEGKEEPESKPTSILTRSKAAADRKAEIASKEKRKKLSKRSKGRQMRGIPPNFLPEDFILYKKCLYLETINEIRDYLVSHLLPSMFDDLMLTSHKIVLYNHIPEGVVTLTAMLTTRATSLLLTKRTRHLSTCWIPEEKEASLSFTILQRSILHGNNLVHICLYSFCRDFILRSISLHARNLKYLNVTDSKITEDGLFYLCGRDKYYKSGESYSSRLEAARPIYRVDSNMGCFKLEHFEATHVLTSNARMPDLYTMHAECRNLSESSPFVLMLQKMKNLRVFLVTYGCMAVATLARRLQKNRQQQTLKLQIVADDRPCDSHMLCLSKMCPDLKQIVFCINHPHSALLPEDWLNMLNTCPIVGLTSKGFNFKSSNLSKTLLENGSQLTHLDFEGVTNFKYSYLKAIKKGCPNLIDFNLDMSGADKSYWRLNLQTDSPIQRPKDEDGKLSKLESFMVVGPFRSDVTEFMLHGATNLKSLSLGIDYLEPFMCPLQPSSRDDYVGKGYLRKVLSSNRLESLEELHIHSSSIEGRRQLDKSCAELVLKIFPKLRHLGNFARWNLSLNERRQLITNHKKGNRSFLFDDELVAQGFFEERGFVYKCVPGRLKLCCNRITYKHGHYGAMSTLFEALNENNVLMNMMEEGVSDDSDVDDEFQLFGENVVNAPLMPFFNFAGIDDPLFDPAMAEDDNDEDDEQAPENVNPHPVPLGFINAAQVLHEEGHPEFMDNDHVGPFMEVFANDFHNQCVLM